MRNLKTTGAVLILAALACRATMGTSNGSQARALPPGVQAISFLGDTLGSFRCPRRRASATRSSSARRAPPMSILQRTPTRSSGSAGGWRILGRIREAIDVYSRGIALYPDNPWLYRHRGHRYLSVREVDRAAADLERATELMRGKPDEVEPDGQPNARNMPIGTLHSNIAYHLGLAYYLRRDFARAIAVYRRELDEARNDDRRVSTAHWLYMSLRRLGRDKEAADVLAPITRHMNVIENETYHRLLLMYKGELPADSVLVVGPTGEMSVTDATGAYGVGNWHLYNGRRAEAERVFRRILLGGQWGAFGYITAEAELARMR